MTPKPLFSDSCSSSQPMKPCRHHGDSFFVIARMYMAPDPHDVLYENLAEDDINASSWKWLGTLDHHAKGREMAEQKAICFFFFFLIGFGSCVLMMWILCGLNLEFYYYMMSFKKNMSFVMWIEA